MPSLGKERRGRHRRWLRGEFPGRNPSRFFARRGRDRLGQRRGSRLLLGRLLLGRLLLGRLLLGRLQCCDGLGHLFLLGSELLYAYSA